MALSGVVARLSDAERAREPRSLAVVAFYDGWGQSQGMAPMTYVRHLDADEARHWREGWAVGKADAAAWDAQTKQLDHEKKAP